jgi:hypothetical protein
MMAISPPTKQKPIAANSAASVIGGRAVVRRSGHGRRSRPDIAVTLAAAQRLKASVIVEEAAAIGGDTAMTTSINGVISGESGTSAARRMRIRPLRMVSWMLAASVPSISRAAKVVRAAMTPIQSRMRPTGYHSNCGVVASGAKASCAVGRPSKARCASHQAGRATATAKLMP